MLISRYYEIGNKSARDGWADLLTQAAKESASVQDFKATFSKAGQRLINQIVKHNRLTTAAAFWNYLKDSVYACENVVYPIEKRGKWRINGLYHLTDNQRQAIESSLQTDLMILTA